MIIVAISINLTGLGEIPKWFFERIQIHERWVCGAWFTKNSLLWYVDDGSAINLLWPSDAVFRLKFGSTWANIDL